MKDMNGVDLKVGDKIIHAYMFGPSPRMKIAVVLDTLLNKIQIESSRRTRGGSKTFKSVVTRSESIYKL